MTKDQAGKFQPRWRPVTKGQTEQFQPRWRPVTKDQAGLFQRRRRHVANEQATPFRAQHLQSVAKLQMTVSKWRLVEIGKCRATTVDVEELASA